MALHAAIAQGSAQAVELALRQEGTQACARLSPKGELPLHVAARLGQARTLRRLLQCAAELEARTADAQESTALHLAAGAGHQEAVALLLQAGADPVQTDASGAAAARRAEAAGHAALAELLDDRRFEAGDYELSDVARVASRGISGATKGVADFAESMASSFAGLFGSGDSGYSSEPRHVESKVEPRPKRKPVPAASASFAKSAAAAPVSAAQEATVPLQRLAARVSEVEAQASGHLRDARGWQDELTKVSCELDMLELGGDQAARQTRRALLAQIDTTCATIERRMADLDRTVTTLTKTIDEVQRRKDADSGRSQELLAQLSRAASELDALECATEAQRAARKLQLGRIESLEAELRKG